MSVDAPGQAPAPPAASIPAVDPPLDAAAAATPEPQAPAVVAPVIPDSYVFAVPEGQTLDQGFADALTPAFKELGLTQEQVDKILKPYNEHGVKALADAEAKKEQDFKDYMAKTATDNIAASKKAWGNDYEGNLNVAQRGLARFMPAEGKQLLDDLGVGNHPAILEAFLQAGKMIQEDRPPGGGLPNGRKTTESVLYPSMNS